MASIDELTTNAAPPDWSLIQEDILCPLCEYNLRMLSEPRCPECGYQFDWPDMLDPTRRLHRYLFEHHPERNWWSFWKTALGGLRPRRFWTALQPVQPSYPKRLLLYWILTVTFALVGFSVHYVRAAAKYYNWTLANRSRWQMMPTPPGMGFWKGTIIEKHGSLEAALAAEFPLPPSPRFFGWAVLSDESATMLAGALIALLLWPWLTVSALLVFRWSMRRARVKAVHVARCVVYNSDVTIWWGLAVCGATLTTLMVAQSGKLHPETLAGFAMLLLVLWIIAAYRTWMAYRKYLRFPNSFLAVLSSQVIVLLVLLKGYFMVMFPPWGV